MIKVLVTGPSGDVGRGVIECLTESSIDIEVYKLADSWEGFVVHSDPFSHIGPHITADNYVEYLCQFINEHHIDLMIPCIDAEIPIISRHRADIEYSTGALIFAGSPQQAEICDDKFQTSEFLKQGGFTYPETRLFQRHSAYNLSYPFVLKSRRGHGSKDVYLINNETDLSTVSDANEEWMIQEYLQGDEFTAGIYRADDGEVKGSCIFQRKLRNGSTWSAKRIIDDEMDKHLHQMAHALGLKYVNIQFRLKNGVPCPFEFNGRFSGTTGMMKHVFNAPEMLVRELVQGEQIQRVENNVPFHVLRTHQEHHILQKDLDDFLARNKLHD